MLRQSLLYLSESQAAQQLVTGTPLSRRVAERFVAGESLDDAIRAARTLNEQRFTVSLVYLGESITSRREAEEATEMFLRILEPIAEAGLEGNISLKPTQLGLDINEEFCRENVRRILSRARELGDGEGEIFVRLDMESSEYTERTIRLVEDLWAEGFRNVGTVVQSYLYRTPRDVQRLNALGSRVRLCKGAYNEPLEVAYPDKADVDRQFVEEMQVLLEEGVYAAIATHDEAMIDATRRWTFERGIAKSSFEFQMLYGVRRDLQARLLEEGYNVRIYLPFGESWYPYLMRRMAERPANLLFIVNSVAREAAPGRILRPVAVGTGVVAGTLAALAWRTFRNSR